MAYAVDHSGQPNHFWMNASAQRESKLMYDRREVAVGVHAGDADGVRAARGSVDEARRGQDKPDRIWRSGGALALNRAWSEFTPAGLLCSNRND